MATRFRKSKKIAPGVRVNFGKKGVGLSVGNKWAGYSVNTSGRKTKRVSIPGTGLSFVDQSTKSKAKAKSTTSQPAPIAQQKSTGGGAVAMVLEFAFAVLFVVSAITLLAQGNFGSAVAGLVIAAVLAFFGYRNLSRRRNGNNTED